MAAPILTLSDLRIQNTVAELEDLKKQIAAEIKSKYTLENLRDSPLFRAYRDFFWRVGIDPTKIRPAAEALIRRILSGKSIPTINTLVDAYNLASIRTGIALAAFDKDHLKGDLLMRTAMPNERFLGIGMDKPMQLNGGEVVVADREKLIAVYPYRDASSSSVTAATKNIVLMVCGCPGIDDESLLRAKHVATEFIERFCGGNLGA